MLNPKHKRYADRLRDLVEEGQKVAALEKPSGVSGIGAFIQNQDQITLQAWLVKVGNIIGAVFGSQSPHFRH